MGGIVDAIVKWTTDLMEQLGGPGVAIAVALENLFPPIPSEIILPLAGFTAGQGKMSLVGAIVWATIGSLVGALALYWVGRAFGQERIHKIAAAMPLVKVEDVVKTEEWFNRHGLKAVLMGRCVPIIRSLISIPAGVEKMPLGKFSLYTTIGSAVWNTALVMAGYFLGQNWEAVDGFVGTYQKVVIVVILVLLAIWLYRLIQRRRRETAGRAAPDEGDVTTDDGVDASGAGSSR